MPRADTKYTRRQSGGRPPSRYSNWYQYRYGSSYRGGERSQNWYQSVDNSDYQNYSAPSRYPYRSRSRDDSTYRSNSYYNSYAQYSNTESSSYYGEPTVVLLTDSILKYCDITKVGGASSVHRGSDLVDLVFKQRNGDLPDWSYYDLVIIHCGTNDVANGQARFVHRRAQLLVDNIKKINPHIDIIFSSILPRPCDIIARTDPNYNPFYPDRNEFVKSTNRVLKLYCRQTEGLHFWPSFHTLVDTGGSVKTRYYARDMLHLNVRGWRRMSRILKTIITRYYRGQVPFRAHL